MYIRMLRNSPCSVAYGAFNYRVEPVRVVEQRQSYISARLLTSSGELWSPVQEQVLTEVFSDEAEAERVWSKGFDTRETYFLLRALVRRLIDDGYAEQIEAAVPVAVGAGK